MKARGKEIFQNVRDNFHAKYDRPRYYLNIGFPVHCHHYVFQADKFVPRGAWNVPMLISISSMVNHFCITSTQLSDFSHIIINYNSNSSVTVAEHLSVTAMLSFCIHFQESFIKNHRTA